MNTLSYKWVTRQGIKKGIVVVHERKYIDFLVDNQPVKELFGDEYSDKITMLGWTEYRADDELVIEEFLKQGSPSLKSGRTVIYCCPECGDLGCGAITTEVIETKDKFIWKDFAYENEYERNPLENSKQITQFEFDKQQYISEFAKISKEVANTSREY